MTPSTLRKSSTLAPPRSRKSSWSAMASTGPDIHSVVIAPSMPMLMPSPSRFGKATVWMAFQHPNSFGAHHPPVRRRSVKRQPVKAAALLQSHPKLTEPPSANSTIIPRRYESGQAKALRHSRPLDVHTWSDHREVNTFVNDIYKNHFNSGNARIQKKHIKVVPCSISMSLGARIQH